MVAKHSRADGQTRHWRVALLVLALLPFADHAQGLGPTRPAGTGGDAPLRHADNPAADLAASFRLGADLERLANAVARSTVTYTMVPPGRVAREIHQLVPKYQARWDANLARAYALHLSQDELRSLADRGPGSPYYQRLLAQRPAVGADMERLSKPLLGELVAEALTRATKPS